MAVRIRSNGHMVTFVVLDDNSNAEKVREERRLPDGPTARAVRDIAEAIADDDMYAALAYVRSQGVKWTE